MSNKPNQSHHFAIPPKPTARQSLGKTLLHSLAFGLLFIPITIVVLFVLTFIEWWRYDNWSTEWMWKLGGFPGLGLFSIASASFFLHKTIPCRFVLALAVTAIGTTACDIIGNILMITPQMYKSIEIQWQRPEFLVWLLLPPWINAAALLAFRRIPGLDDLSRHEDNRDITKR
jgi:hypothetical protein